MEKVRSSLCQASGISSVPGKPGWSELQGKLHGRGESCDVVAFQGRLCVLQLQSSWPVFPGIALSEGAGYRSHFS